MARATLSAPTEAFGALARRLTGWYVFVAVGLVVLVLGGGAVGALLVFAHETNDAIAQLERNARISSANAIARGVPFVTAVVDFQTRERREGVRSFAFVDDQHRDDHGPPGFGPPPGPPPGPPRDRVFLPRGHIVSLAVIDGHVERNTAPRSRFDGNRLGFGVATLFGIRGVPPVPFVGGYIAFVPDATLFANIVLGAVIVLAVAALISGILAAMVGRYITERAIRPLLEVTEALQRFAARDFAPRPIAVDGQSDFAVLAHAYNAAAAQVAAAFAERDAAEAQMRQFIADAGHELRTPLTIVLGYIDLLRRRAGTGDERTNFIYASVASEGRRMRTLIDNLVLLAKLEGDDARPVEPFAVGWLVDEIVKVRRELHPQVQIDVDLRVVGTVIADAGEIHEALANVVDNAIKYAPGSPIAIAIDSPRAGTIVISVSDRGPGIPPADRASIFERFFRGATRGEVEGSGLGLAIAKRALERAGGSLVLDPAYADGTRFVLTLRAERVERNVRVS